MNVGPFAVAIPARDEEVLLPRLLDSLVVQNCGWDKDVFFLVANNCRDDTVRFARQFERRVPITIIEADYSRADAHVGTARKCVLDAAADWLDACGPNGILLTTDADAWVPDDWVSSNNRALEHSDIAGGKLIVDCDADATRTLDALIDAYWAGVRTIDASIDPQAHDPSPRHGDHTGASLAFNARLYRELGGLMPLPSREDVDFVDRALRAGSRLAHPPSISVHVSARKAGRATGGMAAEMERRQSLQGRPDIYLLPHPQDWIDRSLARRRLRSAWRGQSELGSTLTREGVPPGSAQHILAECPNEIAFVERTDAWLLQKPRPQMAVDAAVAFMTAHSAGVEDKAVA